MSDTSNNQAEKRDTAENGAGPADHPAVPARRRLLKGGASLAPIVLTLASRPVLAWHCKSPSAWGSEQLNPTTSLATNQGHASYADETWTIYNWKTNTSRASLGTPWSRLGYNSTNWKQVKLLNLQSLGLTMPPGVDINKKVVDFLGTGTEFQKTIVVAQLNCYLLSSVRNCVSLTELKKMASGSYSPPHLDVTWNQNDIIVYLQSNWIAVPS